MKIQLKHSETLDNGQAVAPQAQYMLDGEVAVNMASADPRLFLKLSDDTIGNLPVIPATGGSYLRADSADEKTSGYLRFNDNIELQIGSGDDLTIKSDGTHSYFDVTLGADIFLTENNVNKFTFDMGAASFTSQGSITSNTSIAAATGMTVNSNTVWHAGNDGSGSGLDADTLDGISSASFLRSDQNTTKTSGYLRLNDNLELQIGTGDDLTIRSNGTHTYFDVPSGADIFFMEADVNKFTFDMGAGSFTSQGSITSNTSIAASTGMTVNSNTVWHAGNDGSGSGLDADTIDGEQPHTTANLQGYKDYEALIDFGSDAANTERRIISASLANQTYSTIAFQIEVIDNNSNHAPEGTYNDCEKSTYFVTCSRTDATTLDSPDNVTVTGPRDGDLIRARKISTGNYEVTLKNTAQYKEYRLSIKVFAVNGSHTIAYHNGDTPSTATASYTSGIVSSNFERFQGIKTDIVHSYFGIYFGTDTGGVNTLDDYEEGTWSPTLTGLSSSSYTISNALYTKIGRVVHCQVEININSNSDTSYFLLDNLPFTPQETTAVNHIIDDEFTSDNNGRFELSWLGEIRGYQYNTSDITYTQLDNNEIYMQFTYFTNA